MAISSHPGAQDLVIAATEQRRARAQAMLDARPELARDS